MSLGKNIRRMRRDKGWTQTHLSNHTGIRIGHISKLEQDEGDPKLSTIYKLMKAFSCSPDSLLMDLNRVNTDAIAWGVRQQFVGEKKSPFGLHIYRDPVRSVLDETPETVPADQPEKSAGQGRD